MTSSVVSRNGAVPWDQLDGNGSGPSPADKKAPVSGSKSAVSAPSKPPPTLPISDSELHVNENIPEKISPSFSSSSDSSKASESQQQSHRRGRRPVAASSAVRQDMAASSTDEELEEGEIEDSSSSYGSPEGDDEEEGIDGTSSSSSSSATSMIIQQVRRLFTISLLSQSSDLVDI